MSEEQKKKTLVTPVFRLSWPTLFSPRVDPKKPDQKPRYSCTMIFEKGTNLSKLETAVEEAVKEKWGASPPRKIKRPFNDGDEKEMEEYHGNVWMSSWTTIKPKVFNIDKEEVEDPGDIYPGCLCKAVVHAYAYSNEQNGVNFTLHAIMKVGDAERFGGSGMSAEDALKAFDEED